MSFLRNEMGLADLEGYFNQYRGRFPELCNVVFWGDQGDGIILMSQTNIQAVHQLLVERNGWRDYFFDMAVLPRDAEGAQQRKYLLDPAGAGAPVVNARASANVPGLSVGAEWSGWSTRTAIYN